MPPQTKDASWTSSPPWDAAATDVEEACRVVPIDASTDDALPREVSVWQASLERIVGTDDADPVEVRVSREQATLQRALVRTYREEGIAGLLDKRRSRATTSSVDPRVVEVLGEVLASRAKSSTVSRAVLIADISRRVRDRYGDEVTVPSRSTLYRLIDAEDRGRHSFGSAKTRETLSLQPGRDFVGRIALRPGEQVQIDSTPLDVMVRIDDQTIGRPDLTIMVDVATRSVLAAVLRPESTKSMDLVVVLARALVPYARRPEGARETRRLISTAWAEEALVEQERYERLRDAQPFIFPETITTDRGKLPIRPLPFGLPDARHLAHHLGSAHPDRQAARRAHLRVDRLPVPAACARLRRP